MNSNYGTELLPEATACRTNEPIDASQKPGKTKMGSDTGHPLFGRENAARLFVDAVRAHTPESPCCIFVDGPPGSGKTEFVLRLLRESDHSPIRYDASDVRNKAMIATMDANHTSTVSVMDIFYQKTTKLVTVMDDVDSFFKDKGGGADSLFRMIRSPPGKEKAPPESKQYDATYSGEVVVPATKNKKARAGKEQTSATKEKKEKYEYKYKIKPANCPLG